METFDFLKDMNQTSQSSGRKPTKGSFAYQESKRIFTKDYKFGSLAQYGAHLDSIMPGIKSEPEGSSEVEESSGIKSFF